MNDTADEPFAYDFSPLRDSFYLVMVRLVGRPLAVPTSRTITERLRSAIGAEESQEGSPTIALIGEIALEERRRNLLLTNTHCTISGESLIYFNRGLTEEILMLFIGL